MDKKGPSAADRKELKDMVSHNNTHKLQVFLQQHGEAHLLLFWNEIEEYKSIPVTQGAFVQGRAHKVRPCCTSSWEGLLLVGAQCPPRLPPACASHAIPSHCCCAL